MLLDIVLLTVVVVVVAIQKIRDVYEGDVADAYCLLPVVFGLKSRDGDEALRGEDHCFLLLLEESSFWQLYCFHTLRCCPHRCVVRVKNPVMSVFSC